MQPVVKPHALVQNIQYQPTFWKRWKADMLTSASCNVWINCVFALLPGNIRHAAVTSYMFQETVSRADCECGYYRTGCPTAFVGSQCSSLIGRYPGRRLACRDI